MCVAHIRRSVIDIGRASLFVAHCSQADIRFEAKAEGAAPSTKINVVVEYSMPAIMKEFNLETDVRNDVVTWLTQAMRNFKELAEGGSAPQ